MRKFESGATRDTDEGKLDWEGFFHPLVLERYAEYMDKHRKQADGSLRGSDNWWGLFGKDHYSICMKSGFRHFVDWWKLHRGMKGRDTIEEAICALLFNAQAYLLKLLIDRKYQE
jgi:hypothetical protein